MSTANDPVKTDYKKGLIIKKKPFSLLLKKKEGGRYISGQFIQGEKKNGINLKMIWYQPYTSSFVKCFNFFQECFVAEKFKTGRTLSRKNSIIAQLKNTKPGTLYITRALLTLLIFLEV